jgi:hypothetical protein
MIKILIVYLNSYSAEFNKFSLDNFNKKFTIGQGHADLGCTVRLTIDYQSRIIPLRYTATTTITDEDIDYALRKYKIIIKVGLDLTRIDPSEFCCCCCSQ